MAIIHLTDKNFTDEVLKSELLVLADFWAPWCMPCKIIVPVIEELAKEYQNKIKIGKLNVDENPKVSSQYAIMSIPTLILFKNGQVIKQMLGIISKQQLKKKIEEYI